MPTPKDRMVQVLRWYLGAFHAGRPSEIAKKPYNPILGETFKCHWHIPEPCEDNVSLHSHWAMCVLFYAGIKHCSIFVLCHPCVVSEVEQKPDCIHGSL